MDPPVSGGMAAPRSFVARTAQVGERPGLPRAAASARRHLTQERGGGSVLMPATQPMAT